MSFEHIFLALLGLACSALGWFGRELYTAVTQLKNDLAKLEVKIGTDYVRYDRLQDAMKPVMERLDKIQDALSHKADRDDITRRRG